MSMFTSPIEYWKSYEGADIFLKRDDRIPVSFGGNKVRMAAEAFEDMARLRGDLIISYGSATSNMNRVIAQMSAVRHIPCRVIMKKEGDKTSSNEALVIKSGVGVVYCLPANVRETVDEVMKEARDAGKKPYYIYGDSLGHGNEPVLMRAFVKEYREIRDWADQNKLHFDHIFLAVGTGLSISGLFAGAIGKGEATGSPRVHGISISRDKDILNNIIKTNLEKFYGDREKLSTCWDGSFGPDITDDYLLGGYGLFDEKELKVIRTLYKEDGIALDPVYTGKAFYGMLREIEKKHLGGNCLFIHTGGYPLFEDAREMIINGQVI